MFSNMKNKIREKTGSDLPKLSLTQKTGIGRHSRQGSETSLSSLDPQPKEEPSPLPSSNSEIVLADGKSLTPKELNKLSKREDEWRNRLEKRDAEWTKKLEKKEADMTKLLEEKEIEWRKQEQKMTEDLLKLTRELKEALKIAEESKRKIYQYQEDKDQLEGFQTQEIAKLKHLLLAKEQENSENATALKEANSQLSTLRAEVKRLRPFEEQVSNFQDDIECLRHTSEKEQWALSSKLAQSEEQVRHLEKRVEVLNKRSQAECIALGFKLTVDERVQALLGERTKLERQLEEAHIELADIKATWSNQIKSLETQVERLSRQAGEEGGERRKAEVKIRELEGILEYEIKEKEKVIARIERITAERDTLAQELKTIAQDVAVAKSDGIDMATRVVDAEQKCSELTEKYEALQREIEIERTTVSEKVEERIAELTVRANKHLYELEEAKQKQQELLNLYEKEKREKDEALLRNAQVSQEIEMTKQELRNQELEINEIFSKNSSLDKKLIDKTQECDRMQTEFSAFRTKIADLENRVIEKGDEKELRLKISDLESQLTDRNKNIRVLQQRLADMKKTLQRELKGADPGGGDKGSGGEVTNNHTPNSLPCSDDDVNFKYLKHVLIKFLTCRDYEAQHLTRAVATLLRFSAEEERLLRETLEWRKSWFGSRPRLSRLHPAS
ncbi:golgin subfamily A member 1-like [Macrosteles quadrilineatus]|uniref:golgin subfamily A member 1-like n=1 Tax=Macrosteles quadrilineatus TaxID=74068 RepID=UPI0023E10B58|nr:golgin subfamily A member 1-like [Macrosteles quadrilineatus]